MRRTLEKNSRSGTNTAARYLISRREILRGTMYTIFFYYFNLIRMVNVRRETDMKLICKETYNFSIREKISIIILIVIYI